MGFSDFWFGPGRGAASNALDNGSQYAYVGANPYGNQQNALIEQLMKQSRGEGPSLAGQQYQAANQDALANQVAMSRGRGPGAMRAAGQQMGQMNQGLAAGSAMARTREQLGAMGQLQGSLSAANQADFQRAAANQSMYQNAMSAMMQQGGIGQSLAGLAGQGLGAYAMLRGPSGGGGNPYGGMAQGGGQSWGGTPMQDSWINPYSWNQGQ